MHEDRFPGHKFLPYLLIAPSIAVIFIFLIGPFGQSIYSSFFVSTPFGTRTIFVGLRNYIRLFSSPDYLNSAVTTFKFAAFVIIIGLSFSLAIAQLLNQKIREWASIRSLLSGLTLSLRQSPALSGLPCLHPPPVLSPILFLNYLADI